MQTDADCFCITECSIMLQCLSTLRRTLHKRIFHHKAYGTSDFLYSNGTSYAMGLKETMILELPLPGNLLNNAKYVQIQFRPFYAFCFTFPISQQFGEEPCLRNHCQHCTCSFKRCSHHVGELSSSWQRGGRHGTVLLSLQALSQCQPLYEFAEPA